MVKKEKIYCYVDESGQDIKSEIFVVVAVLASKDRNELQNEVIRVEEKTKVFKRKWHKSRNQNKYLFLHEIMERKIAQGDIYFGRFKKPTPYFLPIIEAIEKAIISKHFKQYRATVCVDGIDKKKSEELTKALRNRNIRLNFIKSCRDESEPLIVSGARL